MKLAALVLVTLLLTPAIALAQGGPNLVVNGDFENHSGTGCQYNITNPIFGTIVPSTTAFGAADEIDLMTGACYGPPAILGTTKVGLHSHTGGTSRDELALALSAQVSAGSACILTLWVLPDTTFTSSVGQVEVGLSTSPTAFGTLVFTTPVPQVGVWTQFTFAFTAPITADQLTVSSGSVEGWTHVDGVELRSGCAVPVSYCTAKQNSLGCVPAIGSNGCASASSTSGFTVTSSQVRNQKPGLLLYGVSGRWALPFQGGFLCVGAPIKRSTGVGSDGTPPPANDCTGSYSIDMNAFARGLLGGTPLPALTVQGTVVDCEWWGRDPGFPSPNNTTLSDALEYVVGS